MSSSSATAATPAHGFAPNAAPQPAPAAPFVEEFSRHASAPFRELLAETAAMATGKALLPSAAAREDVLLAELERMQGALVRAQHESADLRAQWEAERDGILASIVQELRTNFQTQMEEIAAAALRLTLEAAERIVRRELAVDPEAIERLLRDVLWRLADARSLRLRVSPQDAQLLESRAALLAELHVAEVVRDRRVTSGGCLLESGDRAWDATVEGQLEQLRLALARLLEKA
jgi:flagellar biosynthesis/type III secretory pathway protein FliH